MNPKWLKFLFLFSITLFALHISSPVLHAQEEEIKAITIKLKSGSIYYLQVEDYRSACNKLGYLDTKSLANGSVDKLTEEIAKLKVITQDSKIEGSRNGHKFLVAGNVAAVKDKSVTTLPQDHARRIAESIINSAKRIRTNVRLIDNKIILNNFPHIDER